MTSAAISASDPAGVKDRGGKGNDNGPPGNLSSILPPREGSESQGEVEREREREEDKESKFDIQKELLEARQVYISICPII